MALSFSQLKSNRSSDVQRLADELSKTGPGTAPTGDDRFWNPTLDKAGNGSAIIRFLPAPEGEDVPFIRYWDHGFKGPGGWYIENSLTSIGQDDPLGELNSTLWNSGNEKDKEIARSQKRRLHFVSNIYVIKDPATPDNEGKVFLFKYGKKIFDKLNDSMNPSFDDDKPVNPFDLWEGANFRLRIRQVEGWRNYDKSEFDKSGPLLNDEDEMESVWRKEHSLSEILDPKNFKSYDELKRKLNKVLGSNISVQREQEEQAPRVSKERAPVSSSSDDEDDGDDIAFFRQLAEAD